MNAFELFMPDGKSAGIYACGKCRLVYSPKWFVEDNASELAMGQAEKCCRPPVCNKCGVELPLHNGWVSCDKCRRERGMVEEASRFEKAEKISWSDWDGPVYCEEFAGHHDGYFENLEHVEEYLNDHVMDETEIEDSDREFGNIVEAEIPKYMWACIRNKPGRIDVDDLVEGYLIDWLPEEWGAKDLEGADDLQEALDTFIGLNQDIWTYDVDYKKAILLDGLYKR